MQLKTLLRISELEASLGKVSSLVLIPHRDLHRLPLHTLFSLQFTTTYLPSLQVGLTLKQRATNLNPPANFSLLSLADPRGKHTERLESAEVEATLISQHFHHATTLPTSQATTQNVITQLEATDPSASATSGKIFNFSGHAWAERQPKHSALHLQGEDRLTAETICKLNLKDYELVTLSACETAVTGLQTIESDYVGLVSAFLTAGAANIISTLWIVESESNAWLMTTFYQHYAAGDSPALALKEAQTWLRTLTYPELATWLQQQQSRLSEAEHSGPYDALSDRIGDIQSDPSKINSDQPPYADPYYWAAFTVTGYLAGHSS
ncbi:MAG: CHAT domain-containing protein [Cyanobacteria bacterium J06581_3]